MVQARGEWGLAEGGCPTARIGEPFRAGSDRPGRVVGVGRAFLPDADGSDRIGVGHDCLNLLGSRIGVRQECLADVP